MHANTSCWLCSNPNACKDRSRRSQTAKMLTAVSVRLVTFTCIAVAIVSGQESSQDQAYLAKQRTLDIANDLYGTLRNIAFPAGNAVSPGEIENRFLLLMPGKVLNYFDYFPGKEYTKFIQVNLI